VAQLENCFPQSLEGDASSMLQIFKLRKTPRLKLNLHKEPKSLHLVPFASKELPTEASNRPSEPRFLIRI